MPKKNARSQPVVRFDSKGCVVIQDPKIIRAIQKRLKANQPVTVRLAATPSTSATVVDPVPVLRRIPLFQLGCLNTMCDCPVRPPKSAPGPIPRARAKIVGKHK